MGGGLPAGIVDSAFASLGTFAAGIAAVNLLSDADRGVYGVYFAAFIVGSTFAHNLVYLPYQVFSVGQPMEERLAYIGRMSVVGTAFSTLGAIAIVLAAAVTASHTTVGVTIALLVTGVSTVMISATQDNLRRMLHVAERHWSAAAMSVIQFVIVSVMVLTFLALNVPVAWIPFGALLIANIVSLTLGYMRAGGFGSWDTPPELAPRVLVTSGRWLLGQALIPTGATFIAASLITTLAGAVAMGHAEAARLVSQPVLVLATGLTAVLGPRVMSAAIQRDSAEGLQLLRKYSIVAIIPAIAYFAIAGFDVPWNPMALIVPAAYAVGGLVAVMIIGNLSQVLVLLRVEELMGARREVDLVRVSFWASVCTVAIAATAKVTGAFAYPLGILAMGTARYVGYRFYRQRFYAESQSD